MEFAEMTKQKIKTIFCSALLAALIMLLQLIPHASAAGGKTNVLVYMVASDLESHDQAATKDIEEMLSAARSFGEDVRLIVYAGGAEQWHNDIFSSEENRCVKMDKNGAELLYADGTRDMTDPQTLADFIKYCGEEFPADRTGFRLPGRSGRSFHRLPTVRAAKPEGGHDVYFTNWSNRPWMGHSTTMSSYSSLTISRP